MSAQQESGGVSVLVDAINQGDVEKVRALLSAGTDPNKQIGRRSAIGSAIVSFREKRISCNIDMLRVLLEHGADPNRADPVLGILPLHQALDFGDVACIELLRKHGAIPDADSADADSSMMHATKGAILTGNMKLLELPLAWGVDPNVRSRVQGMTALFQAVFDENVAVLKALLDHGVNPCIPNDGGATPLDYAHAVRSSPEILNVLEKATAACTAR